jgi:hypothetical protein
MISCCATSLRFRTGANGQGRPANRRDHVTRLLLLWAMLLPVWASAQTIFPVQSSLQLLPPYSVYLSDYAQPGAEKLRVILLQRDLSQSAYSLRLVLSVELNGRVVLRTARAFNPPPLVLDPGVPTVIAGADLSPYLDSRNLEFVGYSREQYEKTRALPEGSYRLCVAAYDYRRPDVPVATEACAYYFLSKSEPPLVNYPACGTKLPAKPVQQVVFSWLPRNTASANSVATTEYEFSLYEVRPAGRNVNDVMLSSRPIYQVSTGYTQLVYGASEPALQEGMQYAWRVQAKDQDGKDSFRNNGYSEVCSFTYGGVDPAFVVGGVRDFKAQAQAERRATLSWQVDQKGFEGYRVEYKKAGAGYEWFKTDTKEGELKVFDLEPDTGYEARVQGQVKGVYGPYSEVVTFHTPKARIVACGENLPVPQLQQGRPLAFATPGMSIQARGMEVILEEVEHLPEDGFYKGTGRVSIHYLGGAAFAVKFDRIYIDEDRNVVSGRIEVLSQGVEVMSQGQLASQQQRHKERQQQANRDKYQDLSFAEGVTKYDELIIANVQVDPSTGQVILTDEQGKPYQDAKLSALVASTGASQTLVIEDKNGDQWIIKPDKTAEKVSGGGLPPVNKALVSGPAVDLVKKALKELRKEYSDQKILQLDNERKRQDQLLTDYLTRVRQEMGVSGTVIPTADAGANDVIILDAGVATAAEANPVHVAKAQTHKTAERAYNLGVVVKIFAAETASRKEYELIAGALKIEGQAAGAFITARQAQGATEEALVVEVKQSILALIGQILDRN